MIVLLLGGATLAGSAWMMRRSVPGPRACLWVAAIGVLAGAQIWLERDRLASYQVTLLGQRFRLGDEGVVAVVSGDRDRADYHVPGAGRDPVAVLSEEPAPPDSEAEYPSGIAVRTADSGGATAVVVVTTRRWRGSRRLVLNSVAVAPGDRIRVRRPGAVEPAEELEFVRSRVSWRQRSGLGGTRDEFVRLADGRRIMVPYPEGSGILGLGLRRPGVYQRTYPLAELAAATGVEEEATTGLRSFLYYQQGEARLAVLDERVEALSPDGVARAPTDSAVAWREGGLARLITVAGLPYRDFPDPTLAAGERYGVRPLRSFRVRVDGDWATVRGVRPEVHAVQVADLDPSLLMVSTFADSARGGDDALLHPVRIAAGDGAGTPAGLTFASPANGFAPAGQAVLRLPDAPATGWVELLSPSGVARWNTGRPFTLSDGRKGLLVRVDGLAASPSFFLLLGVLFLLAAAPFVVVETSGVVRCVALAALGLATLRFLLSLSAMARYPFVAEGHQIGLWLIPALPWFVCALGRVRGGAGWCPKTLAPSVAPYLAPTAIVALAAGLILLAAALFPGNLAKAGALTLVVAASAAFSLLPARRLASALLATSRRPVRWLGRLVQGVPVPWSGVAWGASIFFARIVLDAAGFREQIALGGTRIGLSVLHAPISLAVFAFLTAAHHRRVSRAAPGTQARVARRSFVDLAAFLALAYGAVSAWISDFGIAFTTLPGPLLVLALAGAWWGRRLGRRALLVGAIPLSLFILPQAVPGLAKPILPDVDGPLSGLEEWSRNELLLLERGDPEALRLIGENRSEALAVMRETMRSYTRGNEWGQGFLAGRVSPQIRTTAAREHVVTGLLASQWGAPGTLGLLAILLAFVRPVVPARGNHLEPGSPANRREREPDGEGEDRTGAEPPAAAGLWSSPRWVLAVTALLSFSAAGLYMTLANYGLVLFTGKNVYLLGLDSLGDTLEAMAILGMATVALGRTGTPE